MVGLTLAHTSGFPVVFGICTVVWSKVPVLVNAFTCISPMITCTLTSVATGSFRLLVRVAKKVSSHGKKKETVKHCYAQM